MKNSVLTVRLLLLMMLLTAGSVRAAATSAEASAADTGADARRGFLTLYLDNDLFGGTDKNYTNGIRLSWISENAPLFALPLIYKPLEDFAEKPGRGPLLRRLTGFSSVKTLDVNYGMSLTQLMFTPRDFEPTSQPLDQRRYAGWLGLGFSVHAKDRSGLNSAEVIFGTTGSNSLAKEAQNFIHDLRNFDKFQGWSDQIPNEFTVDLSLVQKRRASFLPELPTGLSMDGLGELGLRLGTFRTNIQLGGLFRIGINLPADFSDPRISGTAYSHQYFDRAATTTRAWSVYGLFGAAGRGVAHDATLDGPMFSDFDTGNEREPWVGEVYAGFGVHYGSFEFSYVHTYRTKEYEEQDDGSNFGSVAMRWNI